MRGRLKSADDSRAVKANFDTLPQLARNAMSVPNSVQICLYNPSNKPSLNSVML
jgi:hypothetical protein